MNLNNYISLCNAFVLLLKPLVEIAIHDISTGKIVYVAGGISKRKQGDASLLDQDMLEQGIEKIVYSKLNDNGRYLQSVSVFLDNKWVICINFDVSVFQQVNTAMESILNNKNIQKRPESLFKNDWQDRLCISVHSYIESQKWTLDTLKISQKKEIVKYLIRCGAFEERKAADHVARLLHLGRATVFNYLKKWRNKNECV